MEIPYAEVLTVARYMIKADQDVTGWPGTMNLD